MLQKCNRISEGFDVPTRRIEKATRGFQNRGVVVQQVHGQSFFAKRDHVQSPWSLDVSGRLLAAAVFSRTLSINQIHWYACGNCQGRWHLFLHIQKRIPIPKWSYLVTRGRQNFNRALERRRIVVDHADDDGGGWQCSLKHFWSDVAARGLLPAPRLLSRSYLTRLDLGLRSNKTALCSRRLGFGLSLLFRGGPSKGISHSGQKSLVVKRLDEESESAGLPDGSLGGMIFMASNKDNPGLG